MATEKLKIQFDSERILDLITVDEYIELEQQKVSAIRDIIGKFVVDAEGNYLSPEEGVAYIGSQPMRVLLRLNELLMGQAQESAVPKENAPDFEMPT